MRAVVAGITALILTGILLVLPTSQVTGLGHSYPGDVFFE